MEVYELLAEKMVLQAVLEALYKHKRNQEHNNMSKDCTRRSAAIWKPAAVDWLRLPAELWLKIFGYLSQAELYFVVHSVCKSFHLWSRDYSLWTSINFHKMHLDVEYLSKRGIISAPVEISNSHLCNILTVFRDYVTSVAMSRFVTDCGLNEMSLKKLCMCSSITNLDVGFCYEADMMSKIADNCTMIEDFNAEGCSELKDEDFSNIHCLRNLRKICISHCVSLTDKFLVFLYDLPNLRELLCDGVMHFTEQGLIEFVKRHPQMEVMILDGEDMCDELVCYAAANLVNLRVFEMSFSQSLTNRSVTSFKGKSQIERLKFRKCSEISALSVCHLFDGGSLYRLRSFCVTECEGITDDVLSSLSQCCHNLESLTVDWCWNITDSGVSMVINNCKSIKHLSIIGLFGLAGEGWLDRLDERLPHLRFLDASDCNTLKEDDLIDLVRRKLTLEVYTYFHERVVPRSYSHDSDEGFRLGEESEGTEWTCPGAKGIEVVF